MRMDLLQRFADLVGPADAAVPLFDASLLFAAALQDGDVWVEIQQARLEIEEAAHEACQGFEAPADIAEAVLSLLRRNHFTGNIEHYEDPRNSLMDRVIERRLGLPITLSVLAMHLCECCGVELFGVGFPGHFLVGLDLEGEAPRIWDPFRDGRAMSLDELAGLYTSVVGHPVEADSPQLLAALAPSPSRLILTRMLENLRRHYGKAGERERVADTLELLAVLHPDVPRIRELLAEQPGRRDLLN
ncbi:MAG: transglutaminase family protein [Myxococcales bacterium]|nr:transglutaminase family protein [Myxococcales bacterium]